MTTLEPLTEPRPDDFLDRERTYLMTPVSANTILGYQGTDAAVLVIWGPRVGGPEEWITEGCVSVADALLSAFIQGLSLMTIDLA